MKSKRLNNIESFQYNYDSKRTTNVEFEVISEDGNKVPKNIKLISNWTVNYPNNPQINLNSKGEYGFSENGVFITNGDIQQIIIRILQIVDDAKNF